MKRHGDIIWTHFNVNYLSECDKAINGYIRIIGLRRIALYTFEDEEKVSRHKVSIGRKPMYEVIMKLVELVEDIIAEEIKVLKVQ